jgi:magnesium-transporting ATPase (P-type)
MIAEPFLPQTAKEVWHCRPVAEVLAQLGSAANGLSAQEVAIRLAANGPNALPETKRRKLSAVVLRQFASPLIYILFIAAAIAFIVGKSGDAAVILVVVILNALIDAFQEGRAERSMETLRKLASLRARVLRGGSEQSVEARDLVPGDVLLLAPGEYMLAWPPRPEARFRTERRVL